MKNKLLGMFLSLFMILFATSAFADSVVQIWNCKAHEGKTTEDINAVSAAWLKAAKGMEGGEDLEVYIEYPLAAAAGFGEFSFVLIAPDIKTWGLFNNDYDGSAADEADTAWNEVASCSGSSLWQSIEMK